MICKNCGTENDENRMYCKSCGYELGWKCICGFINEADANYCGGCGTARPKNKSKFYYNQLSIKQIEELLKEKIFVDIGDEEVINQDDIDKIF